MTLRIALCGAHGTGKNTLVDFIDQELLTSDFLRQINPDFDDEMPRSQFGWILPSAQRHIVRLTGTEHSEGADDWLQLWAGVTLRLWEYEHDFKDFILSPRTGLDNAVYQITKVSRQIASLDSGIQIATSMIEAQVPSNGESPQAFAVQADPEQLALINRAQAVAQVLINQAEIEIEEYWDFVYWKRPYQGVQIGNDGLRSVDPEYQSQIDLTFENVIVNAPDGHPFKGLQEIPREIEQAKGFLRTESERWAEFCKTNA